MNWLACHKPKTHNVSEQKYVINDGPPHNCFELPLQIISP
jgi:hypothetical protein